MVKNVASDMFASIDSDHFPIIADIRIAFKADYKKRRAKPKCHRCSQQQQDQFNQSLQTTQHEPTDNNSITEWIRNASQASMTKKTPTSNPFVFVQKILKTNLTLNAL